MKSFTSFAAALALLAPTTYAATVTLETTQCLQPIALEKFDIEIGTLVVKELASVCGLKINSSSVDVNSLACRAYRDAAGQQPGSAVFTFSNPALIGTNPRQIASIRCDVNGTTVINNGTTTVVSVPSPLPTNGGRNATSVTRNPTRTPTSPTVPQTSLPTGAAERMGWSISAVIVAGFIYLA